MNNNTTQPYHFLIQYKQIKNLKCQAAKQATKITGAICEITCASACCLINRLTKEPPTTRKRTKEIYESLSQQQERQYQS